MHSEAAGAPFRSESSLSAISLVEPRSGPIRVFASWLRRDPLCQKSHGNSPQSGYGLQKSAQTQRHGGWCVFVLACA